MQSNVVKFGMDHSAVAERSMVDNIVRFKPVHLKADGTPKNTVCNKRKGESSEVFHYSPEDMKLIQQYFADKGQWLHYMMFVLSCNMARRNGDMRSLTWRHFFNPSTGKFRENLLEITEEKTDKFSSPRINSAVRAAITLYLEKTGCDPSEDGYSAPICKQLSGNYKGRVMSYSCCLKAIKKAAEAVGIEYNVGTHSARKTFGATSRMLHPNDTNGMELLQTIYNHTEASVTNRYIGLTKAQTDKYYDDMGEFFDDYVTGDKELCEATKTTVVSLDVNDLRDIIKFAYEAGRDNADSTDAMVHMDTFATLMAMVDEAANK